MPVGVNGTASHHFVAYFGPADFFTLAKQGHAFELERAVDLGWNWITPVSRLLLQGLRVIAGVVHNYGLTILLLAFLIRLALHPMNLSSMKSMRAMQRLQPELERLRERHKNDPQALNAATIGLYREHNVNPASGCLPMLLQMPLFFALYATINNAIDLRQAPFVGWIHDLSAPDTLFMLGPLPVRLLPIIMTAVGFLGQVFTPTQPEQAPTMYMMNLVMLFVFYNMPSGLVLYWTTMNLFNAVQQWMAKKHDEGQVVVAPAPSPAKGRKKGGRG